jgi:hypothetical protein
VGVLDASTSPLKEICRVKRSRHQLLPIAPLHLPIGSDRPDVARPQRRLGANKLALVKVCEVQACRQQAIDGLPWSVSLVERQISMCLR